MIDPTVIQAIRDAMVRTGKEAIKIEVVDLHEHGFPAGKPPKGFVAARYEVSREKSSVQAVIPEGHRLRGVSTLQGPDGAIKAQWVKTTKDPETPEEILQRLLRELPADVPLRRPRAVPAPTLCDSDLLAVYPLGDPHVGMLSWAPETGGDFDLEICEDLLVGAMCDLVLRGPRAERALVLNLGDFFHADQGEGRTTHGHHALDVDGRAPKVLAVGMRIMTALIDATLEHHKSVTVDNRIGNHDGYTSLMLSIALGAHYRNEPRVSIPATTAHRSYYEHGKCLIGITHGDKAKPAALGAIMAAERAELWGRSTHRMWYTGHVHHRVVEEQRGCTVESFRTLAGRDAWHAGQGYVSGRDMHRIVLHTTRGEVSREIVNVGALLQGR